LPQRAAANILRRQALKRSTMFSPRPRRSSRLTRRNH
jgi:hypothetical protein